MTMEQPTKKPVYSVVAPIYNEEGNIEEFHERILAVMDSLNEEWELVLVNDGSHDRSMEMIMALSDADSRIQYLNFARNFGHQTAVTAGMDFARGDAVIIMDADLQDPPEVIPDLIAKWKEDYQVVYAIRTEREGETFFKKFTAKLFYRLISNITDVQIPVDTGDFRLMDRRVVNVLHQMREHNRFIRGMTSWVGFRQTGVEYKRAPRFSGATKYPLSKMVKFAWDAVTGFSYFPLQLMIYLSLAFGILAIVALIVIVILRLGFGPDFFGGQATTIVLLLLTGAFQFFFLFILGQYLARVYDEARNRPLYVIATKSSFGDDSKESSEN